MLPVITNPNARYGFLFNSFCVGLITSKERERSNSEKAITYNDGRLEKPLLAITNPNARFVYH